MTANSSRPAIFRHDLGSSIGIFPINNADNRPYPITLNSMVRSFTCVNKGSLVNIKLII